MILDFEIGHDFKHDIVDATEIFKRNELQGKRSLVETVNSVLKRVQITSLRSKLEEMKNRELAWHIVLYNLKRIISFWLNIFQEKLLSFCIKNTQTRNIC